ncbi:reverse transcriptase RNA-dependent DNA polymerase [Nitzschia inconspicua]|uniref:Reverse transcriptase RNA-dependent DNA polymerase n=1 Tax=Nitzschia inconspicua TaxID=303405 RepID=A0A9K3PTZ8_9STRA|nr:reverse transcriptase RNA-dependent DNA polymerase [Nitzschia inconspicua]
MSMPATSSGSCVPAPTRVSSAAPVPAVASNAYSNNSGNTGKCNKSSDGRNHGRGRNRHHRGASSYVPSIPEQLPKDCRTPERYITINMEYFGYIAIFFLDIKNLTIMKDRDVGMDEFAIELALWFEEMWTGEIRSCGKGCTLMENLCAAALKFGCAWILASIKGVTHRLEDKRCVNLFITHAITDFHILQQRLDPSVADCYQWCYSKLKFAECCAKDLWCFVDSAGCCRRLLPYLFLGFSWLPSYLFLGLTGCCPTSFMGLADCCNMFFFAPTTVSSAALTFAPTIQAQDDVLDLDYAPAPTANQSSKENQGVSTDHDEVLFRGTDVHSLGEDQGANHDGSCGAKKGNQGAGGTANYLPPADLENDPLGIIQNEVSSQDGSKVSLGLGKGAAKALSQRHPSIESRDGLHNERETDDFLHRDNADQVPAENQGVHVNQDDVLLQGANMEVPADDQGSIQEAHAMENQGVDMAEKQGAIHFVVMRNSFKTPSVCFHKALYGCVKSVLLWYNHLASTLMDMGFELNLYYPCAANKMVNGKQCTVAWYVDDNNISHMDPQVVTNVITALEEHIGEMTVTSGCCHKCLGMDITFNSDGTVSILMEDFNGTVSILMEDYLKSVIEFLGEPISSSNATDKGLLDENPDPPAVDSKERIDLYGSIVPKGRASAGQKSLHINIHHYFITNHVKTEGLNIIYCPAEAALAVFFTKLLKGALFRKFRDVILAPSSFSVPATSLREERVGKNDKTPTLTENAEKHSEAANHAEKRLIPGEPGRRTYADVLRGCEDLKTDVPHGCGIADRNNENVHRGCKSIADGVVCTNKIGDGVVSAKLDALPVLVDNGTLEHNLFLAANLNSTLAAAVPVQDDFLDFDDADQLNQGISVNQGDVLFQGADMENAVEDQGARRENQFVVKTSGVKTPFLHFLKALYRCVKSALFWCNVSASTLTDVGYTTSTLTDVGYKTSVDFSFVVPPNSNTHTGGAVSLGLDTFKNTENQVFNRG